MTTYNRAILEVAGSYLGLAEVPGLRHNPEILRMFEVSGNGWVEDDETPWCAAFANMVLAQVGLPTTGKLNARSFDDYGKKIELDDAMPGDLVRLWRNSPTAPEGHIGFLVKIEGDQWHLRGGNQRDPSGQTNGMVTDAPFPRRRVQAVRRADGTAALPMRPVLRKGDEGFFVLELQDMLRSKGYYLGGVDTDFGKFTEAAVLGFQADNGLTVDGVVGPQTWAALKTAPARTRAPDEEKIMETSRTISDAQKISTASGATVAVASVGSVVEVISQASEAESALQIAQRMLFDYWPALIVILAGFLFWRYAERIVQWRLDDARTGKHLGR